MSFTLWITKGEDIILKPYQKEILNVLDLTGPVPLGSRDIWEKVNELGESCSRASVINFLTILRNQNLLVVRSVSGKGGMHEIYRFYDGARKENIYFQIGIKMIKILSSELPISDKAWSNLLANSERA